jgi:hypothetical protein
MRPPSLQLLSVQEAFGSNGWHCEDVEGRDVVRALFEAHHVQVELHAQAFPQLNALVVVAEAPLPVADERLPWVLELLARANKQLTLGGFEFDLDRSRLVFRITNLFEREKYDPDIVSSMVHCAVAELDRIAPYALIVCRASDEELDDLDLVELLGREDLLPPVPDDDLP